MKSSPQAHNIGVIIPAYRVANHIQNLIRNIPKCVDRIIVVDDACPENSGKAALELNDPRVHLVECPSNGGVGAAMKEGFKEAIKQNLSLVIKLDGDGQMDPKHIPDLVAPILQEQAAMTKGNRFWHFEALKSMPLVRRIGNIGLSFLSKIATGHWHIFDPTNGYIAIRTDVLKVLDFSHLSERYFFETSLLAELGARGFRVEDVPIPAVYGNEESSLSVMNSLFTFPIKLAQTTVRRIFFRHFWFDFTGMAVLLLFGLPLTVWGVVFGTNAWLHSIATDTPASAGTVMLAALPFLFGMIALLQAFTAEIQGSYTQRVGIHPLDSNVQLIDDAQ